MMDLQNLKYCIVVKILYNRSKFSKTLFRKHCLPNHKILAELKSCDIFYVSAIMDQSSCFYAWRHRKYIYSKGGSLFWLAEIFKVKCDQDSDNWNWFSLFDIII